MSKKEILYTVGPVEMYPSTLKMGALQLPYFRTQEFSDVLFSCEAMIKDLSGAPDGSRAVFLTASGTGAMEAAVVNVMAQGERALIINGGSFGERFCEICAAYGIEYDEITVEPGKAPTREAFDRIDFSRYRALFVNAHETSTGVLYDIPWLGELCERNGLLFVVDAISCFLCDPLDMNKMHIDMLITSSQKALALGPGISVVVLSSKAVSRVSARKIPAYYFSLDRYLRDGERGQTPFTPAVGIVLQLRERLAGIHSEGIEKEIARKRELANWFRSAIAGLPFRIFSESPSNALTALSPTDGRSAYEIYAALKEKHGLIVTPNGGKLKDSVFRVGHMGNLKRKDLDKLVRALKEI